MQHFGVKCMKMRVAVIFVVQLLWILSVKVVAIIPRFFKEVAFTEVHVTTILA